MALVVNESNRRKALDEEIEALAFDAAREGRALNARREAERLSQRYPVQSVDELAAMILRACSRVTGSAVELGIGAEGSGSSEMPSR